MTVSGFVLVSCLFFVVRGEGKISRQSALRELSWMLVVNHPDWLFFFIAEVSCFPRFTKYVDGIQTDQPGDIPENDILDKPVPEEKKTRLGEILYIIHKSVAFSTFTGIP